MNLMNNGQMDRGNENPALMIEENHEKTSVRLVGTGIRTRDLPNARLVRYHGATSLGKFNVFILYDLQEKVRYISIFQYF